jgi:hypothetical protein
VTLFLARSNGFFPALETQWQEQLPPQPPPVGAGFGVSFASLLGEAVDVLAEPFL